MQVFLIEVKLSVVRGALYIMDMVSFFFVDEQIPVHARHFAHQVKCLASVITIGVLLYDLLLVNRVEIVVDDVVQLEHEVILILLRIQLVELILRFRIAAEQERTAEQQRLPDDFRVVLDRDEFDHHLDRPQFNQHVLRVTHFCFHVRKVFSLPLNALDKHFVVLRFHDQPQEFEASYELAFVE